MRDLKFRAWGKKDEVYLHITKNKEDGVVGISPDGKKVLYLEDGEVIILEDVIIEPSIGLKDKNGKEIYGGDIVKCHSTADEPCLAVVRYGLMPDICGHEYCPCRIGFYLDDKVYFDEDFGEDDDHGEIEVIGNIHENPELLGGEE